MRGGARLVDTQGWGWPTLALTTGFVLHKMEQLSGLPGWIAGLPESVVVSEAQLSYAFTGLTILVAIVLLGTRARPAVGALRIGAAAVAGAMLANGLGHLVLCALTRSYMPGSATALALVVPTALWLLWRLPDPRWVPAIIGALAMVPVTWLALWLAALATA